jgi:malto-oligosyltrehalose trehalohydrolase
MTAMRRHHELPFGAELVSGGVRFRVWAPRAGSVALVLEEFPSADPHPPLAGATGPSLSRNAGEGFETRHTMLREPGGWFALTTERAAAGARYRYVVDSKAVPDPAARFQPDGVHGASEVVDPGAYSWTDTGWRGRRWEELVIYELHLGAFSESGGFAGAVTHLDHLAELGVTAIELMPIGEFPGRRNWGYDGVQLFAPASRYGRPVELKALVEACHARGLAILLDVVYNHFGPEGNYLPTVAPDFFTERHHTPWGAAINYDGLASRPVRDFVIHNALYWLREFHFDGLRLDAVHAIIDDGRPDIVAEIAETVRREVAGREVHLILENDRNEARRLVRRGGRPVAYTAQWNDALHHALHVLLTGQTSGYYGAYAERPIEHLGRALVTGSTEPAGLPATAFIAFLQNHDQIGNTPFGTRLAARAPEPLLHAALAIVLLAPQIPMLFMGEEWASARPFLFFCDFAAPLGEAVRRGRRREFAQFPEFSDPASAERIPDPTAEASFVESRLDWPERDRQPHACWLERYRRLLALRARAIAPRLPAMAPGGCYRVLGPRALQVEWRMGDGALLRLLANFADTPLAPVEPPPGPEHLLYSSAAIPPSADLPPCCTAFYLSDARIEAR